MRLRDWYIYIADKPKGISVDVALCSRPTGGHREKESLCLTQ